MKNLLILIIVIIITSCKSNTHIVEIADSINNPVKELYITSVSYNGSEKENTISKRFLYAILFELNNAEINTYIPESNVDCKKIPYFAKIYIFSSENIFSEKSDISIYVRLRETETQKEICFIKSFKSNVNIYSEKWIHNISSSIAVKIQGIGK